MFLLQQHFNQQKEQQLRQLSRVGMPTPPAEREDYQQHNLTSSNASLYPVDIEQIDACSTISSSYSRNSSISDALFRSQEQEDRITYSFPPTFVWIILLLLQNELLNLYYTPLNFVILTFLNDYYTDRNLIGSANRANGPTRTRLWK